MSKGKRRRKGQGGLYKRKTSNNWILRYTNADGTPIQESSGTDDKTLAQAKLVQKMAQVGRGEQIQPKTQIVTVQELYENFLTTAEMNHYRDIVMLKIRWELHLQPFFGKMKVMHVTKDLLEKYVVKRQREDAADATINREISIIRRAFYLNEEKIGKMPKFPQLKENNARKGFVEDMQYQKLVEACSEVGLWLRAMFEVAYSYGWRSGGLKKMKVSQVNLFDCTITLTAEQAKNKESITVPITKDGTLYRLLAACVSGKEAQDYLFSRDAEGKMPIVDFRNGWKAAKSAAGMPNLLFHDLRRTAVRNMERSGIPRKVGLKIAGFKTESVYQRYFITTDDDVKAAVMKIEGRKPPTAGDCIQTAFNGTSSEGNEKASESIHLIEKAV